MMNVFRTSFRLLPLCVTLQHDSHRASLQPSSHPVLFYLMWEDKFLLLFDFCTFKFLTHVTFLQIRPFLVVPKQESFPFSNFLFRNLLLSIDKPITQTSSYLHASLRSTSTTDCAYCLSTSWMLHH